MKSNMSTCATSSSPSKVALSASESPHVTSIGPRQIVCTTRIFSFGGARLPLYTHDCGEPSSKLNRYANRYVGCRIAGSETWNPWNSRDWASFRTALEKPPDTVGGTFAIVADPLPVPRPLITEPWTPVKRMLSIAHHQSSLLSYRNPTSTLACPPTPKLSTLRSPWSIAGLLCRYCWIVTGHEAPPSKDASMNPRWFPLG